MTKLRKWLVAGLMVIVTFCVTLGSALLNVTQTIFTKLKASAQQTDYAYSNTNGTDALVEGKVISVKGLAKTATLNDENGVLIPKKPQVYEMNGDGTLTEVTSNFDVVVEVKNPYGDFLVNKSVLNTAQISDDSNGNYVLKPSQVGMYTVQYAVKAGNVWTLSNIYQINVTAEAYTYDFVSNDTIVMPSKIDTRNQDLNGNVIDKTVDISLPVFYDENGETISSLVLGNDNSEYVYIAEYKTFENVFFDETNNVQNAYPTILTDTTATSANGRNIYEQYSTYQIKKVLKTQYNPNETKYGLLVEVSVPGQETKSNSTTVSATENLLTLNDNLFAEDKCFYAQNPYNFEASSGKNIVTYKLCNNTLTNYATPHAYANKTINGTNAYDSTNIAIGASTTKTIKSSDTSIGKKIYLPEVNVVDNNENKNAINAYYYYNVKFVTENGYDTSKDNVVMGIDEDGIYFIPKQKGSYNISYNARDFYNNQDANYAKYDYTVTVTDREAPKAYFVDTYDYKTFTKEDAEKARDMSYLIPTKAVIAADEQNPTEIALPALYTYDTVSNFEDLRIEITISSKEAFLDGTADKKQVKNFTLDVQENGTGATTYDSDKTYKNVIYFKDLAKGEHPDFYIKNENGKSYFYDNNDVELSGTALIKAKSSQVAYVKLNPALFGEGKYVVEYSVSDKSNNSNETANTFEFELVKEDATTPLDETAPTVKFGSLAVGNVVENQEITISTPKIEDNLDKNTLNRYYVLVEGETDEATPVAVKKYLEIIPQYNESTKQYDILTFNTADKIDGETSIYALANTLKERNFKIVAFAFDDISDQTAEAVDPETIDIADIDSYTNIGFDSYTVTLLAEKDTTTPYISQRTTQVTTENNEYNQFSTVSVNGIKFYDNTATARVRAQVFDSKGNTYAVEELEGYSIKKLTSAKEIDGVLYNYEYTYPGVKFTANKADNYTINYTVVDNGRNSASYSFVLRAATDKEAPVIDGVLGTYDTLELGETFYLNTLTATDNTASKIYYSFNVVGENGVKDSWFNPETKQFTPEAADTYTITVKASDKKVDGNYSTRTFVIKVADTKAPTLTIVEGSTSIITVQEKEEDGENDVDWSNSKFPTISLPIFAVADYNQNKDGFEDVLTATGSLTITTPDNDSYTINIGELKPNGENPLNIQRTVVGGKDKFVFTPTSRGHYVAKYTAEDKAGNKATPQTIDVYIGDTEQPVITLNNALSNALKNGFTLGQNAQIVIDPKVMINEDGYTNGSSSDVTVTDNFGFKNTIKDSNQKVYTNLSVQVVDSNNSTVSQQDNNDGLICYTFDKAGTYTITFTVTDSVGNSGQISRTFKVSANTSSATDTAKILGTVLIVVSIVILAGVVIYFVKGTKMLPKRKKAKKQPKEVQDKKED